MTLRDGRVAVDGGTGLYSPSELSFRIKPLGFLSDNSRPAILYCHSAGFTATQGVTFGDLSFTNVGQHLRLLVGAGAFYAFSGDDAGSASWMNDSALASLDGRYGYATTTGGARVGLVGVVGESMGGGLALNWVKRNAAKVGGVVLFCPVTDLDYAHTNIDASGTNTAYGGNYAVNSVGHNPIVDAAAVGALGIPILIVHGDADVTVPIAQSQAYVAAANVGGNHNVTLLTVPGAVHATAQGISPTTTLQFFQEHLA